MITKITVENGSVRNPGTLEGAVMGRVLYVVAIIVVVVGVDFAFFRERFPERLIANIGIVLVFGVLYWIFFRRP